MGNHVEQGLIIYNNSIKQLEGLILAKELIEQAKSVRMINPSMGRIYDKNIRNLTKLTDGLRLDIVDRTEKFIDKINPNKVTLQQHAKVLEMKLFIEQNRK